MNLSFGLSRAVENDDFFGILERVLITFTVYPRIDEFLHIDIQGTRQKSYVVSTAFETIAKALLYWNSRILHFRFSSEMLIGTGKD